MLGLTWLKVKFELKLSKSNEKENETKTKLKWMRRQIKDDVKFGKYE